MFTKCDALWAAGFGKLKPDERKLPPREQFILVTEYAKEILKDSAAWKTLKEKKYPPKDFVNLESKCDFVCCNMVHSLLYRCAQISQWM